MSFAVTGDILDTLGAALGGGYLLLNEERSLRIMTAPLSGQAVAAAAVVDEQLVVVIDLAKPDAIAQARILLAESGWRLFDLPEGTVLPIPEPTTVTRLAFAEPASPRRGPRQLRPLPSAAGASTGRRWS